MIRIAILANKASDFCGMTNFLRRLGLRFTCFDETNKLLHDGIFEIIFIGNSYSFNTAEKLLFKEYIAKNRNITVICCGFTNLLEDSPDWSVKKKRIVNPYWPILSNKGNKYILISLPGYEYLSVDLKAGFAKYPLFIGKGYFLNPSQAQPEVINKAYLIYRRNNMILFSLPVFKILGDILLGEVAINNYLNWYDPLFWIDEYVAVIKNILEDMLEMRIDSGAESIVNSSSQGIIVLKHDTDSSIDTSYLDYEQKYGIAASYSILLDNNMRFWLEKLKKYDDFEVSFHYNTIQPPSMFDKIKRCIRPQKIDQYKPWIKGLTPKGLFRQFNRARKKGMDPKTLTRHGPFLSLPEFYKSMQYVCQNNNNILGSASLFRGIVLNNGAQKVDGINGYVSAFPGTIMPFWLPIKPFLELDGKAIPANFWESTHLMETDPAIIDRVLNQQDLIGSKPVYFFGFHPFHAKNKAFNEDGCFPWFKYLIEKGRSLNYEFLNLSQVYERMNKWENRNAQYLLS